MTFSEFLLLDPATQSIHQFKHRKGVSEQRGCSPCYSRERRTWNQMQRERVRSKRRRTWEKFRALPQPWQCRFPSLACAAETGWDSTRLWTCSRHRAAIASAERKRSSCPKDEEHLNVWLSFRSNERRIKAHRQVVNAPLCGNDYQDCSNVRKPVENVGAICHVWQLGRTQLQNLKGTFPTQWF